MSGFIRPLQGAPTTGQPAQAFTPGDKVAILSGPFAGLEAIYTMPKSADRALLLISLLGRQSELHCHWNDISPVA